MTSRQSLTVATCEYEEPRQDRAGKPIKVLFLIDEFAAGGTERQVAALAESLDRERFEPTLGVFRETTFQQSLALRTPVVAFERPAPPIVRHLGLLWRIRRFLQREQFDVVMTHLVDATIYGAWAVRMCRPRPKLITTRRNLYWWASEKPYQFRFLRASAKWTDCVLTNSHRAAEECRRRESVCDGKLATIQNMIDVERFVQVDAAASRARMGIAPHERIVGVVGNWRPIKGTLTFLKAAEQIAGEFPLTRFILAGDGPQEAELREFVRRAGLEPRVIFIKAPPNPAEIMAAFDIAVQPSHSESFSNVLIEYMASRKPVVATRVGDAESVIEDGVQGWLVAPDDVPSLAGAIRELLNDPSRGARMSALAFEKVSANWSQSRVVREYEGLFQALTANGNASAKKSI